MRHEESICRECRRQTRTSIKSHFPDGTVHLELQKVGLNLATRSKINEVDSIESLKDFHFEGFRFGLAVLSSLVTQEKTGI